MSVAGIPCYEDGFRLAGPPSECSLRSKARIDALFEDSRSICSSTLGGWYAGVSTVASVNTEDVGAEEQRRVNSAVQARIEAMFASVEAESGTPGECAAAILPVKYMGAAPVGGRVASVRGLQEPLRQLLERMEGSLKAELEVSRRGLTFRTSEICEKNNPFRRIAVWSALRLRCKRVASGEIYHAFLPLVGDNELGQGTEDKHADLYRTMRGLKAAAEEYPPIFAVVMRRPGAARVLECHAFACETEEDAVAAAATLYRALLADLDGNRRRPRHANGVGCVSLASVASSVRDQSFSSRSYAFAMPGQQKNSGGPAPIRPPRSKKSSIYSNAREEGVSRVDGRPTNLQKAPRRKKKNSDIKAEDVLEARNRRRIDARADRSAIAIQRNYDTVASVYDEPEVRKDLENHEVDKQQQHCSNQSDTRSATRTQEQQSFLDSKEQEERVTYEQVRPSRRDSSNSNCNDRVKDLDHVPVYDKVERSLNLENAKLYEQSAKKCNNREKQLYEERLRNADRIYVVEQEEDLYSQTNEKDRPRAREIIDKNIFFSRKSEDQRRCVDEYADVSKVIQEGRSGSKDQDRSSVHSGTRVSRVLTMDKPLRKPRTGDAQNDSKLSQPQGQPRARKRSRAGSEPPVGRSEHTIKMLQEGRLKRSQSDLDVDRGDLMTRVELPRRGSFLKPGSTGRPNNLKGGTPLGFTELFDEFRNQEGLTSVDDILAAIIDPEGMSFNDLKPLYKEFLLKLASTLTQDELYQRSASIMKRRRRPQRRRSTRRPCLLGRAIKRSVSRLKGGPTEFTSVIFPARRLNDSFGSSSSCDAKNNHRNRVLTNRLGRRRSSWKGEKIGQCHTTSEDSDTCRRLNRGVGIGANRSSSGYVSCSECSYDSESCTCMSADKCYCSLTRRTSTQQIPPNTIVCACDTDSCSESNKCYCASRPAQSTILEQLKQKGIVPSESTLSRAASPDRVRSSRTSRSHTSSRSSELLKVQVAPACGSSDNLALDYDLFSPGRKSQQSINSEKVLVVSARDTQGRLVYVGGAETDDKGFPNGTMRSNVHHEALSIKKSAEIAAIFGSDSNRISRRVSNASSIKSSISLEAGLGYLP